jgi:D-alanyl-D-alanine dipeptidase
MQNSKYFTSVNHKNRTGRGYAKLKIFYLSESQKQNRKLLSNIMKKAGFIPLSYEWRHFSGMPKDEARKKYLIIN